MCPYPCLMIATKGSLQKISLNNNGAGILGQATLMIGMDTGYSILSYGISFEKNKIVWSDGTSVYQADSQGNEVEKHFEYGMNEASLHCIKTEVFHEGLGQVNKSAILTEEIFNRKLHFLCNP